MFRLIFILVNVLDFLMTAFVNMKFENVFVEDNPFMYKIIEYGGITGLFFAKLIGVGIVVFWVDRRMSSIAKWIYLAGSLYIGMAVVFGVLAYAIAFR